MARGWPITHTSAKRMTLHLHPVKPLLSFLQNITWNGKSEPESVVCCIGVDQGSKVINLACFKIIQASASLRWGNFFPHYALNAPRKKTWNKGPPAAYWLCNVYQVVTNEFVMGMNALLLKFKVNVLPQSSREVRRFSESLTNTGPTGGRQKAMGREGKKETGSWDGLRMTWAVIRQRNQPIVCYSQDWKIIVYNAHDPFVCIFSLPEHLDLVIRATWKQLF